MNLHSAGYALDRSFEWVWATTLDSALLIGLVFGLQRFGRKWLGPRGCYMLSLLVLVRLVLPSMPVGPWSLQTFEDHIWHRSPTALQAAHGGVPLSVAVEFSSPTSFRELHPREASPK